MSYRKHAYVLVFDGFADHGITLALRELHVRTGYRLVTAAFERRPVTAASGLRVLPDISCAEIQLERAGIFMLPDGAHWTHSDRARPLDTVSACVTDMLQSFDAAIVPVAGIGGATLALARAGLLADVSHTSNSREYLAKHVAHYDHAAFYVETPAIRDENVITAHRDASAAFAQQVTAQLGLDDARGRRTWPDSIHHPLPVNGRAA